VKVKQEFDLIITSGADGKVNTVGVSTDLPIALFVEQANVDSDGIEWPFAFAAIESLSSTEARQIAARLVALARRADIAARHALADFRRSELVGPSVNEEVGSA
jgi:hypothetical protein